MSHHIVVTNTAHKQLLKLPNIISGRIERAIDSLADIPRPHGIKALKGMANTYRLRVADYRVVYSVDDEAVLILIIQVAHRREVYRQF